MTKAKIKGIIIAAVILIAAIIVLSTAYTVKENQFGIVKQFGKVVTIRDNAGFYLKIPIIEEVSYLPKTLLFYDVTPSDVLTSDKKALVVDSPSASCKHTIDIKLVGSLDVGSWSRNLE
mgnify:CR=1 FL=1